jgi:hypothetical protein
VAYGHVILKFSDELVSMPTIEVLRARIKRRSQQKEVAATSEVFFRKAQ